MAKDGGATVRSFFRAFLSEWIGRMSGGAGIVLAVVAFIVNQDWQRYSLIGAAVLCVVVAAYRIWKVERAEVIRLNAILAPRIELLDLDIFDDHGEQYVRVRIKNTSGQEVRGVKVRLEQMTEPKRDSLIAIAHNYFDLEGNFLDLPIQLFTQQRLKERIAGGDAIAKPFDLAPSEKKWIEVFQTTNTIVPQIHIYDLGKRHDVIPLPNMTFECEIVGGGPVLPFILDYTRTDDHGSMRVVLSDAMRKVIQQKDFIAYEQR